MHSPEHRRTPQSAAAAIPFALGPAHLTPPTLAAATLNGQTYQNLNASLAAQVAALPPLRAPGRRQNVNASASAGPSNAPQVCYYYSTENYTSSD